MKVKKFLYGILCASLALAPISNVLAADVTTPITTNISTQETAIVLSDKEIVVNGQTAPTDSSAAVYTSHDIIYYEDRDTYASGNAYGEGTAQDKHTKEEADKHTVVHITQPGTYHLSGKLSYGQIFVNVGKEEQDKVTLILDQVDINCSVAPAIFFYNVYECDADSTTETASNQVDTSQAGARVILADDTTNQVTGAYVARIYKDNAEQKKLHKYDGAFYSRMSMEIDGETKGNGILNIQAANEGLDTERHLTINGGVIHIESSDDGINVNEDGISVFTMNAGYLTIYAGNGSEGDGIDSNGWNVINGGTVISLANPKSMDGGIDSDMGSTINGGTVIGAGNMYDPLENSSKQLFMSLELAQKTDQLLVVTDASDTPVFAYDFPQNYTYISLSTPQLKEGTYHVYEGGTLTGIEKDGFYTTMTSYTKGTPLHHGGTSTDLRGDKGPFGMPPTEGMPPSFPQDGTFPQNRPFPQRPNTDGSTNLPPEPPTGMPGIEHPMPPEGQNRGNGGGFPGGPRGMQNSSETETYDFVLSTSNKSFTNVSNTTVSTATPTSPTTNTTGNKPASNRSEAFSDVKKDSEYAQAIAFCKKTGLMTGTTASTFSPDETMTREMFATILYRLANSPQVSTHSSFEDVEKSSAYYYPAISWASQEGITSGISATRFGVGQAITLKDAATLLENYKKGGDLSQYLNASTPSAPATRGQIAALLMSYCAQ